MLTSLKIQNYLFVPHAELSFGQGMTAVTGETGAGKSILVGAISLIFADTGFSPEPFDSALPVYLEAVFEIKPDTAIHHKLDDLGQGEEAELILARQISTQGRSSYFLNGRRITANVMKELQPLLVDFHHQRDQQRLLSPTFQLEVLDNYACSTGMRKEFSSLLSQLRLAIKQREELSEQRLRESELAELYRFQLEELDSAALQADEDTLLQQEYERLSHSREIGETAAQIHHSLYEGEGCARDLISGAQNSLHRFANIDERAKQTAQTLADILQLLDDSSSDLAALGEESLEDPARLEHIRHRLDLINSLLHKHRVRNIGELQELFDTRIKQMADFELLDLRISELDTSIESMFKDLQTTGEKLSETRHLAAQKLSRDLQTAIRLLAIPNALFKINIDKKTSSEMYIQDYLARCQAGGVDECEFLFSANLGSELKPLSDVASGGELSRVLLAIKKVLASRFEARLMILDEIDSGVGGKTAEAVAATIAELSCSHTVLCVTHLASIAAVAHWQLALSKTDEGGKTIIKLTPLSVEERIQELARMLSGQISATSLKHAQELLNI